MAATAAVYNRLHNASLMGGGGSGGHQTQLARSLERILDEAHHSGELILTNRKLKDFPKTATKYNLSDTVIADLSRNRFCELPEDITTFSFLETLLLYHNTIRTISESVKHLTSLTYLDLRSNQLSSLPREICFLPLQVLLVSNNRLTALPDELGRMDRLTDLDAAYNQLSALPARIGELRSLRSLSLRSNQLVYLPRELTCLTLISLDVSNNRISSLPLEIRQMSTLVEFNLENNPLTSPPASLCVRGLVHVFKFLETQATKDEKGSRAGGNYDGYTTLRRAPRHNSSGNVLESNRVPRHHVDSGYSTCDGIDKRWSHDMPGAKPKSVSPVRKTPVTPPTTFSAALMDASLSSSTSTIVDEPISTDASPVKPLLTDSSCSQSSPSKQPAQPLPPTLHQHINYAAHLTSSSSGSSPDQEEVLLEQSTLNHQNHSKSEDKNNKNLGNIQTYREYKEALKQQRNQEISSVYKIKAQKTVYDASDATNALNSNAEENEVRCNGTKNSTSPCSPSPTTTRSPTNAATPPKSIMKNGTSGQLNGINGSAGGGVNGVNGGTGAAPSNGDDSLVMPKKPVQKVIPSRYTETCAPARLNSTHEMNGDCTVSGYVKPLSPLKTSNGGIYTNNNGTSPVVAAATHKSVGSGIKSPVANTAVNKLPATAACPTKNRVTWNHDVPADKLSFTMRREFDRQREETELMTQLRSIIETRLKMTLPEDIASALTDGVILCHLANYVRPRSVGSIHVPSPGVSKLTMARCRRNVENFLEACLKIGVDEELICSCADVVPPYDSDNDNDYNNDSQVGDMNSFNSNDPFNANSSGSNIADLRPKEMKPKSLPNPAAVLRTVSALIALDSNPHHRNIKNLQEQQQFQMKLQQFNRTHEQHQHQQQQQQQQKQPQNQQHHEMRCGSAQPQPQQQQQQQTHYEQEQQTATGTKQQQQHEIVANMEFNSTFNFTQTRAAEGCHFENVNGNRSGGNGDNDDVVDGDGVANDSNGHGDVVDSTVNVDVDVDAAYNVASHMRQQQQHVGIVGNFLRHAKLKTFQKIKLNLIPTHVGGKSNHCSLLTTATTTTLQTIVETENDGSNTMAAAMDGTEGNSGGFDGSGGGGGCGGYQVINEKPQKLNDTYNNSRNYTATSNSSNKYKLLELPTLEMTASAVGGNSEVAANKKLVSQRIEFFENTSSSSGSPFPLGGGGGGGSPPELTTDSKSKMNNGTNGVGGGGGIFSIYRVADLMIADNSKLLSADQQQQQQQHTQLQQDKGKTQATFAKPSLPLLRHDSYVLTVILSCVFIVTFLLLVFFPLPG